MYKMLKLLLSVLFCMLSAGVLRAQYTVNAVQESAFAEQEHTTLSNRPTPISVPHLNPTSVVAAMSNPSYLPSGSTPFTFIIAHRGSHTAPGCAENSACAIAAAYEAGADAIELDVKITADDGPVLGHDVAVARELNNWISSTGVPVTRTSAWTPFSNFPILDYTYLDLTKYPFLNNYRLPNPGGGYMVDPNNPTRSTMHVSDVQNGDAVDTYNVPTANHQLTLYEALYLVQKYYPMAIWLDIKSTSDLADVGPVITVARQQLGSSGPLANISLKLGWSTVSDPTVKGNPGVKLGLPNISYLLVFGTGDLDAMAVFNGQPTPGNLPAAIAQAYTTFQLLCNAANGCLGAELSHKYLTAPTQGIYNAIQASGSAQLAGFQTLPQYSWYWQTLANQKLQALTYGRTFPRTDGSCCFALTDSLNASRYFGNETQDLRALYSWNETRFSTITTDEPLIALRDLTQRGLRPVSTAQQIGGNNTSIPSGGNGSWAVPDGLYYIQANSNNNFMTINNTALVIIPPGQPTLQQMWYLSSKGGAAFTLTNAATGQSIMATAPGSLSLGQLNSNGGYRWSIAPGNLGFVIQPATIGLFLSNNGSSVVLSATGSTWTLTPVVTPSSEAAQQQGGPAGYTYCADGDMNQTCSFAGPGSVAYGANGSFRYLQYTTGPIACRLSNFNNIDPAPYVAKACFYAPYGQNWALSMSTFPFPLGSDGGTFYLSVSRSVAYGAIDSNGASLFTYKTLPSGNQYSCGVATFGYDPAPGYIKSCVGSPDLSTVQTAPSGFSYCAVEGGTCGFAGTAAVAYGTNGKYSYKTFTNGVQCGVISFGLDPDPNVSKACFYMAATPLGSITTANLPSTFQLCAYAETGTCANLPQGSLIAYGVPSGGIGASYVFGTPSGSFTCSLATFGGVDPSPGNNKACYWSPQSWVNRGPPGFTFCATGESGTCQFNGVGQVAYGDDGFFVTTPSVLNGVACNLSSFGTDPHYGYSKACYYRLYQ